MASEVLWTERMALNGLHHNTTATQKPFYMIIDVCKQDYPGGVACVRGNVFYVLLVHVALGTRTMNEPHFQE